MNPFKITDVEYKENFGEKKDFLKNLIFLIFKGNELPTKLEDTIIDQTIVEYFEAYFHPFDGFTEEQRQEQREILKLQDKKNGKYYHYEEEQEKAYGENRFDDDDVEYFNDAIDKADLDDETKEHLRNHIDPKNARIVSKLANLISDSAVTEESVRTPSVK